MSDSEQNSRHTKPDLELDTEVAQNLPPLTFWQLVSSTLYAAIGIQKSENRERDFARGKPSHFIIAGIIFTVLFVLAVTLVVNTVLSSVQNP